MRRLIIVIVLLALPFAAWADTVGVPRISLVEGDVLLGTTDTGEWVPASINTPLNEGDSLWCPENARAEVQLPNGSRIRLDNQSQMEILVRDDVYVQFHLSRGRMYVTTSASKEQNLQIDADDTTVLPFGRTRLGIDMKANSEEDVSIFKGAAYVEGGGSRTKVRAGEQIILEEGRTALLPLDPPDQWELWNSERDKRQTAAALSGNYLPDELKPYAMDLDANGSWIEVNDYGMVWRPTVVAAEWAPYRVGRWVWLRGDYVWVSYENWGWAPHHYGRWVSVPSRGWCWVPPVRGDVFWSPGYVGWASFGGSIGWVPLAPGETYFGYGRFGRHSVNVAATTIHTAPVYQNSRHDRSGLTIIHQNDFLKGKTVIHQVMPASTLPASAFIAGRPHIKPERETRMPVVKTIRHAQPEPARQTTPEIRNRFPRVVPQQSIVQPQQHVQPSQINQPSRTQPQSTIKQPNVVPQTQQKEKRTVFPVLSPAVQQPATGAQPGRQQSSQPQPQHDRRFWRINSREERLEERHDNKEQKQEKPPHEKSRR